MTPLGCPILTAAQMFEAEKAAGCGLAELMERAGAAVAEAAWRYGGGARTLVLCGPGNNGGDGYVAARMLAARGIDVTVAAIGEPRTDLARAARQNWKGAVASIDEVEPAPVIVDALFGTGLRSPLGGDWVPCYKRLSEQARFRLAVDLPSGIETDSGQNLGAHRADLTVALGALKAAHLFEPGAGRCGMVEVAALPIAVESEINVLARPALQPPRHDDHKYSRGYVGVVGGVMAGAAMLSARAAMRLAGYVAISGARRLGPDALVYKRWEDLAADERVGALLIGPGLGRDTTSRARLDAALKLNVPLVLDADALVLLDPGKLAGKPAILTPHAGEFAALFGDLTGSLIDRARIAAARSGAVIVLKGANTVVASPGGKVRIAPTAPGWLASAGTGDVLAGLAAAALSQGVEPFEAASTAVWLHGEAARCAGPALIADDLIAQLPAAIAACL